MKTWLTNKVIGWLASYAENWLKGATPKVKALICNFILTLYVKALSSGNKMDDHLARFLLTFFHGLGIVSDFQYDYVLTKEQLPPAVEEVKEVTVAFADTAYQPGDGARLA